MASQSDKAELHKAENIKKQSNLSEAPSKRHRGKSWEAVRSARKAFFNKISSSR